MLAGVGPVPAVLFVVAADEGWMPQSAEHLAALDALGVRHGAARGDPRRPGRSGAGAWRRPARQIRRSACGDVRAVAVSAVTGAGLPELRGALDRLAARLPAPRADGAGPALGGPSLHRHGQRHRGDRHTAGGTVRRGDELLLMPAVRPVKVRALQTLGENATELTGVARAALNLRGIDRTQLARGMALVQPGRWRLARQVDVRMSRVSENGPPRLITVHVGSARTQAKVRMLGGAVARLTLRDPLPLHVADRVLLRDPGASREQADPDGGRDIWPGLFGAVVLDIDPPPLTRRGAATAAAAELAAWPGRPAWADLVRRRGLAAAADLTAMGVTDQPEPVAAGWLADSDHWAGLAARLGAIVAEHAEREPLAPGLPVEAAREALRLPDRRLVLALASAAPSVTATAGVLTIGTRPDSLPPALAASVASLLADLADRPFDAPDATRLSELGLEKRDLAAAARHGALLRLTDQIVLAPGAGERAAQILAGLDQPFTAAAARVALGSTRRTVIPLLEHLDRLRLTQRLPDDRRRIRG